MPIRVPDILPKPGLQFLRHCYRFVTVEWQHADREDIPDQGFESRYRECCITKFVTTTAFDVNGLGACIGLGVHPVAPGMRPLPVLMHNGQLMQNELDRGLALSHAVQERFDDFCARVNALAVALSLTWFSQRFGNISDSKISVAVRPGLQTAALGVELQSLGAECSSLLFEFNQLKGGAQP